MAEPVSSTAELSGPALRRAVLQRLRYEQSLGIETLRPRPLTPRPAQPPAAAAQTPASAAAQPSHPASPVPAAPHLPAADSQAASPGAGKRSTEERWRDLEARAKACTQCGLRKGCQNVVFGTGNRKARLVFVGEGPGYDEDQQGIPFVGKAGQFLDRIITAMKLKREDVYICNAVLCRPPENRKPLPSEAAACEPFLKEQLELIQPRVIVALGGTAAQALLKTTQGIMSIRGRWFSYQGIPVMPTYHPAFVLRQYTDANRRAVWEDMKQVLEKLKE